MKKITYIALLFTAVLFAGCEKYKVEYEGETLIEFKPLIVSLTKPSGAAANTPITYTVLVQLVGPQQSTAINVPYILDVAATTAVAGTHYTTTSNATGTSGTLTIPANSSSASFTVTTIPANVGAATPRRLVFRLSDGGSVAVSPNYRTCTITIN